MKRILEISVEGEDDVVVNVLTDAVHTIVRSHALLVETMHNHDVSISVGDKNH